MSLCVCSVIDQKCSKSKKVAHEAIAAVEVSHKYFNHISTSSAMYYLTDTRQHELYQ